MIDDWDLGRFTVRLNNAWALTGPRRWSSDSLRKPERKRPPETHSRLPPLLPAPVQTRTIQSFLGLVIVALLVVYHYAVAEDAPAAARNQ